MTSFAQCRNWTVASCHSVTLNFPMEWKFCWHLPWRNPPLFWNSCYRAVGHKRMHFYRATACNAMHGIAVQILSVCLSVCPSCVCLSVRRVYCDKTKWRTADIFIPHETAITLVFWHQQWLVGSALFPLKSALKVTHPSRKTPSSTDFRS